MTEKSTEKKAKDGDDLFTKLLILSIMLFGCCLALYSVYMVVRHVDNFYYIVLNLIMFGFGFAAIWFGISHFDIKRTEDKIQKIHEKADRINRILQRK